MRLHQLLLQLLLQLMLLLRNLELLRQVAHLPRQLQSLAVGLEQFEVLPLKLLLELLPLLLHPAAHLLLDALHLPLQIGQLR